MPPPERPKPPAEAVSPRVVAEGAGEALRRSIPPVQTPFPEDIVREIRGILPRHHEGPCELGPYVESEDQSVPPDSSGRLGGQPRPIAFDAGFWLWFSRLTPERRDVLLWIAKEFRDRDRQTAILEIVDERIERRVLRNFFKRLKHTTIAAFVIAAAAAHWLSDQVAWLVDRLPALKALWNLITGART